MQPEGARSTPKRGAVAGFVLIVAAAALWWAFLGREAPRPELLTHSVHDLVSLLHESDVSTTSPYARQPFGLIYEDDNRDGLGVIRVPTGSSVAFHDLPTGGPTTLEFDWGVAWTELPPGDEPVRFRVEVRRRGEPADAGAEAGVQPGTDAGTGTATDAAPGAAPGTTSTQDDDWELIFDEVSTAAALPEGRRARRAQLALPGDGLARWSVRFTTRRVGGPGLALPWPGFLSPQLLSAGRARTGDEHHLETARVFLDLVSALPDAEVEQQTDALPVEPAFLDAAKGYTAVGGRRTCIRAAAPSRVVYDLDVPEGATLDFSIGMDTALGWMKPGDGMRFVVEVDGQRIWERVLRAAEVESDRGWHAAQVDLAAFAGRDVQLALVTETLDDGANDVGGWSHALVLRRDRILRTLASEAPTVVVVLVDTLRSDRLGVYGNPDGLSPRLDAMAREGLFFARAQAASSWTWPSTASLLTGVAPNVHGVHDSDRSYLVDAHETLPELFAAAGYTTAGFSSNLLIGRADNFHQGFETFVHTPYANARAMNERVQAWLADTEGLARFLYVHYFDPHTPYMAPPGWEVPRPDGRPEEEIAAELRAQAAAGETLDPALVEEYRALLLTQYDAEVRYFDHAFGEFLDHLEEIGVLENAIVAFTSDHGEEFYEHRFISHGGQLYDETLGVPFWITGYGASARPPAVVRHPVGNVDLLATLCELADVPLPRRPLSGLALDTGDPGRPVFGQTWHGHEGGVPGFTEKLSMTAGPFKLIHTPVSERTELFHRGEDPGETRDLASEGGRERLVGQLLEDLRAWDERTKAEAAGVRIEGDPDTIGKLQQMGYIDR